MCGKPCRGQGTQGRGETNALPHPPLPHDQPRPLYLTGTTASSPTASDLPTFTNLHATHGYATLPGPQQAPRPRAPSDLPAFAKTPRGTYQPNEPNRPSHIRPTTNHTLHTQQAPRPRPPSDLPAFANLHATHGYTTLPSPQQTPRPRIRTTHALKTQTTSPKTPNIRSISPKWSALWAHPSPTPSDLPRFAKLHATHGYATLPGPHQAPRPRIRPIHALKTQTTSPKTPHIHPIPPKWSALWAHTVQLEARRRRHNGCAYDLHHCGARTLHHRCKQR